MGIKLIKNKQHLVIKRDGREEPFNPDKLKRVIQWATENNDLLTEQLLNAIDKKIYDKIKIQDLYDSVIDTAANLISPLYPIWDDIAKKLYLLKIYKETWNLKKTGQYPHLKKVIQKGLSYGVYSKDVYSSFTDEEIEELNSYIQPDRDFLFNYKGIRIFYEKYCLNYSKTKKLELPQLTYMRLAMFSFHFHKMQDKKERMKLIKDKYDMLSTFRYTEGTPKMINAGTPTPQLSSCVLIKTDDDTYSILETSKFEGIFSKFSGGCADDVSAIRAVNGYIKGNRGISSGVIPFIKLKESVITAFNQGGKRKGSLVINYPYWHYESPDITYLKDAGGSEDRRARKLQYCVKWYRKFSKSILKNDEIYLFDPKDTPKLLDTFGKEFEDWYDFYSNSDVRKRKVKAIDLAYDIAKVRKETGNLYIAFIDNINEQRMGEGFVSMTNLCTEIVLPNKSPKFKKSKIIKQFGNETYEKIEIIEPGEIALCNLASINLDWWYEATNEQKDNLIRNLLLSFDEGIENQFYPVIDGMFSNKRRRPIGIGAFNLAKLFARLGVLWTDEDAKEIVHRLFEDLSWYILKHSAFLAKERGHYETMKEGSKWQEGKVPLDVSILHNKIGNKRPDLNQKLYRDWDYIRDLIKKYGVRFSYHMAIAPTANSVKSINATESTEPVIEVFTKEEGSFTLPNIVPGLNKGYRYQTAFEIDNRTLLDLAAIRQKFIDQSQSLSLYYKKPTKASEIIKDIIYAENLGIKTLYYLKTPKSDDEICESCAT